MNEGGTSEAKAKLAFLVLVSDYACVLQNIIYIYIINILCVG